MIENYDLEISEDLTDEEFFNQIESLKEQLDQAKIFLDTYEKKQKDLRNNVDENLSESNQADADKEKE